MPITIEFLYENGERVLALDDEVLDDEKVNSILNLHPLDTITLGSGRAKQNLQVLKIDHKYRSGQISDSGEDELHHEFTVKVI